MEVKRKGRNKGYDNLIPVKPGEVRNPKGRGKGVRDYRTIFRQALINIGKGTGKTPEQLEDELLEVGFKNAKKGNYNFYKDTLDRNYGTAITRSQTKVAFEDSSDDELKRRAAELIEGIIGNPARAQDKSAGELIEDLRAE